ncbi:non-ribosomal peptide synthetase [Pseudorhodobacter wandonensis]|uniref:non-ribosomal peptide synthetase n=1 Tax=Pseudorhodobacter wandonensis TaxID=1120568 RepID=UPI00067DBEED|nr:non-ribosomal peptide synthetase [Pseudorhodobacter wandonensis]
MTDTSTETSGFALTPVQAGMLYEVMALPALSVNREQVVVQMMDEAMDVPRMQRAWDGAIARHDALRLSFSQDDSGQMRQFVMPAFPAPLVVEDLTHVADPAAALTERLAQDRAARLDLANAASWRLIWLRFGPRHSVLIWSFSHVALDGRGFQAVLQEVFAEYDGAASVAPARSQFQTYCEAVAQLDSQAAKAYFSNYLAGFDAPTPIGFAAPQPAAVASAHAELQAGLTPEQTQALVQRAAQAGGSFATMVQAAWGIVLARISGQSEAVFGITRSGRYLAGAATDTVGCLITTQPLRVTIGPQTSLDAVQGHIRQDLLARRPHEGLGLPDIAAVTGLAKGAALFDSLVMVERQSLHAGLTASDGAWRKRQVALYEQGALPLTLAVYGGTALELRLEYLPDRISASDAARYLEYTVNLLVAMAQAAPDAMLADLEMLPKVERDALMALAQPLQPLPQARPDCFASAFQAIAAKYPSNIAVKQVGKSTSLTYAALDQRANQIARQLKHWGIGPGMIVGLCLPRSPAFVTLLLAASKVGAAVLPMDPSYPSEALHHMAEDSAAAMIFAETTLPWMADLPVKLMSDRLAADAPKTTPTMVGHVPDRAAYVIYTSGTTGRPKGVAVSQRGLVSHALAAIAAYDLGPQDRVLQMGALSFDVALEEIVPTLLAGAALVLRDDEMMTSPQAFVEGATAQGITVLNLPTGFWQVLLTALKGGSALPPDLRLMVVGGERMPPDALTRWFDLPNPPRLLNAYGPTEATITSAIFEPLSPVETAEVPVGRSFGHALAYLRCADGSLAPKGARAELWLGGDAVALGYLGLPDLTEARFVPDPFTRGAVSPRLYRSGDMAYWTASDQLVIAGRNDRQIKLRGFRIEPAEVEAVLERVPGVAQAHVGVLSQGRRLMGWLRASNPQAVPDIPAIAAYIATQLPRSHCPELMFVPDWPQTPGGKIDTRRLPVPVGSAQPLAEAESVDPLAMRLADIFATVLGGEVPPPSASFFDLGGHSLQLLTLIGHIEAAFSTRLSVAQVHANPSPQALAALLSGPVTIGAGAHLFDCLMPIQPLGTGVPIYGVHVLGVNGSFFRPLARAMGLDQPIFGLTVGLLSADTPTNVPDTAALYFQAIQAHRPTGPIGLVAVSMGSYMAFELAQQLRAAGRDVRLLALLDADGPGGRETISGFEWVRTHLALLRQAGLGHAKLVLRNKLASAMHKFETMRLQLGERFSRTTPVLTSVNGFVAANAMAIQDYAPRPYDGHLTIIRASDSVFDSKAALEDGLGWKGVASGGCDVIDIPGNHLTIMEEPGVRDLAIALAAALAKDENVDTGPDATPYTI